MLLKITAGPLVVKPKSMCDIEVNLTKYQKKDLDITPYRIKCPLMGQMKVSMVRMITSFGMIF